MTLTYEATREALCLPWKGDRATVIIDSRGRDVVQFWSHDDVSGLDRRDYVLEALKAMETLESIAALRTAGPAEWTARLEDLKEHPQVGWLVESALKHGSAVDRLASIKKTLGEILGLPESDTLTISERLHVLKARVTHGDPATTPEELQVNRLRETITRQAAELEAMRQELESTQRKLRSDLGEILALSEDHPSTVAERIEMLTGRPTKERLKLAERESAKLRERCARLSLENRALGDALATTRREKENQEAEHAATCEALGLEREETERTVRLLAEEREKNRKLLEGYNSRTVQVHSYRTRTSNGSAGNDRVERYRQENIALLNEAAELRRQLSERPTTEDHTRSLAEFVRAKAAAARESLQYLAGDLAAGVRLHAAQLDALAAYLEGK